ncbi:hypothetical protein FN846DRAFT_255678 [Sphaerosporella brunnea]|uniref:Uncharacterized protein n=1 Tax=Sphaerosporella brunnea TaxID=1250544 RepID=A0A5J5F7L2_9PEZI|nr:hypothetical protein FN846DRAFT_255678 [Sphaerosporella brunnea]
MGGENDRFFFFFFLFFFFHRGFRYVSRLLAMRPSRCMIMELCQLFESEPPDHRRHHYWDLFSVNITYPLFSVGQYTQHRNMFNDLLSPPGEMGFGVIRFFFFFFVSGGRRKVLGWSLRILKIIFRCFFAFFFLRVSHFCLAAVLIFGGLFQTQKVVFFFFFLLGEADGVVVLREKS